MLNRNPRTKSIVSPTARIDTLERRMLMAVAGTLDKSFSGDGKATVAVANFRLVAQDVAVQADGKTVIVGPATRNVSPPNPFFAVARLNLDGTPDTTFGDGGFASPSGVAFSTFRGSREHFTRSVAIQPDGKIVVAGELGGEWAVARYLSNGTLDLSFDGDGVQTVGFNSVVRDIAVQSNGKIVVVGTHLDGIVLINFNIAIARLNPNGSFDRSFDGDGKKQIQFGDDEDAHAVAIDGAGRIILAGESGPRMVLTRLNGTDGSVDTTFGLQGLVSTAFPGRAASIADAVLIQSSGKIVVAGRTELEPVATTSTDFLVGRYLSNGTLDTTFGAARTGLVEVGFGGRDRAFGVIQSANGGMVVAGTNNISGSTNVKLALAGLTANGLIDNNFGTLGKVVTDFGSAGAGGGVNGGIAKGPGRRFVVAGSNFNSARYLDTGANVVSVGALRTLATEGGTDFGSLLVTRTERLPTATRIFFSITGTALGPGFGVPRPDYNLEGIKLPSPFGGEQRPFVDIPANQTFVTVKLTPRNDTQIEGPETVLFSILPTANYEIGSNPDARIDIADNDQVHINFQPDSATVPGGFVKDIGQAFGARNGLSYGWDADNTATARIRNNVRSPDFRYDSLIKMQEAGVNRTWEIAIPNGLYEVRVVAGDPNFTDSIYKMSLENLAAVTGTPGGDIRWFRRWINVQVNDGRLTLANAPGGSNNKVCFIDIRSAKVGARAGNITEDVAVHLLPPPPQALSRMDASHFRSPVSFSDEPIDEFVLL
jgi:uncharacterized delta-60 repeat protein